MSFLKETLAKVVKISFLLSPIRIIDKTSMLRSISFLESHLELVSFLNPVINSSPIAIIIDFKLTFYIKLFNPRTNIKISASMPEKISSNKIDRLESLI